MQKRKNYTVFVIFVLMLTVLCADAHAQPVYIPDANLRGAIIEALNQDFGYKIKADDMLTLKTLHASDRGINDLTGLQYAENLTELSIGGNAISNLSPIANLVHLKTLSMPVNPISDLHPISNLTKLEYLDFGNCNVSDLTPLSNLTSLVHLECNANAIVDVIPLANLATLELLEIGKNHIIDVVPLAALTRLESLNIQRNQIFDHSPLYHLQLRHFVYDQACEMPSLPLAPRLNNRTYPSIFTRWSSFTILNRDGLTHEEHFAQHDFRWNTPPVFLGFMKTPDGFQMAGDLDRAIEERDKMHSFNPNMVHLITLDMRAAGLKRFPEDSPYWIKDETGKVFIENYKGKPVPHGLLDFTNPIVQDRIVAQALAVARCGLYDGIMFDYWAEHIRVLGGDTYTGSRFFRTLEEEQRARDIIIRRIRQSTRPDFLIIGNTNVHTIPRTAPYINGGFMETNMPYDKTGTRLVDRLRAATYSILWLETHTRQPRVNCLEGFTIPTEAPDSPNNRRWMRTVTTLSLTHSDGYVLFNHSTAPGHFWYDFWDADLGRPVGEKGQLYQETEGLYIREFTNGWAVYNHSGSEQQITLPELAVGVASRLEGTTHTLPDIDGEMYLRVKPKNPADVNGDGVVNILDLTLVAQAFGKDGLQGDVNRDGVVNVFDLVFVANQF